MHANSFVCRVYTPSGHGPLRLSGPWDMVPRSFEHLSMVPFLLPLDERYTASKNSTGHTHIRCILGVEYAIIYPVRMRTFLHFMNISVMRSRKAGKHVHVQLWFDSDS